jgi:hypothetical protein
MFDIDRAACNSLSIEIALAFTGEGYFDYMSKTLIFFNRDAESLMVYAIHSIR